ncbi:hypothetical protein LguiA_011173 [Lonicera macranthoides]
MQKNLCPKKKHTKGINEQSTTQNKRKNNSLPPIFKKNYFKLPEAAETPNCTQSAC